MSAGCVRWLLSRSLRAACVGGPGYWTPASRFTLCSGRSPVITSCWRWSPFTSTTTTTTINNTEEAAAAKKNKPVARGNTSIGSVGRKIPQREIQVMDETGESLGVMHRSDAFRLMDQKGLKLVLLSDRKDPAVYQLMSGKQIHEEQTKQREKQKTKATPAQLKELTFSTGIAAHDLSTKLKHVESWLEKKHHVKITLRSGRGQAAVGMDTNLEQMVQKIGMTVGFVSKPVAIRDGQAATCVLRPPSAKELAKKAKEAKDKAAAAAASAASASSKDTADETVSNTDTTEESKQQ